MPDRKIAERPSSNFDASDERTNYKPPVTSLLYLYTVYVSLKCARSMMNYRLEIARDGLSGTEVLNKRPLMAIYTDSVASYG